MSNFQEKSLALQERLTQCALDVIALTKRLPKTTENQIMMHQIIRSATSIGANYTEANNAISKQDFRNKVFIAKKEAAETKYWLDLLARANKIDIADTQNEVQQILMILQKIVSTLKNGK